MMPSGYECFWNMSPTLRSPNGGAFVSHCHGVAARPVAVGLGADVERHADAVAGIVAACRGRGRGPSWGRDSACAIPGWPRSRPSASTTARAAISHEAVRRAARSRP